jgi:hypothetical protein
LPDASATLTGADLPALSAGGTLVITGQPITNPGDNAAAILTDTNGRPEPPATAT